LLVSLIDSFYLPGAALPSFLLKGRSVSSMPTRAGVLFGNTFFVGLASFYSTAVS
jgi:hypothetical protein